MHDKSRRASVGDSANEIADKSIFINVVDAGTMLDSDRYRHRIAHRLDAIRDQRGIGHQAGAEAARLHPLAGTADVEIDLVVAPPFAEARTMRKRLRIAAAQLQSQRMLAGIEIEMVGDIAVHPRPGRYHLGVEKRARAH